MKLIIDIPKSEYTKIKKYYDSLPEYSTVEAETYYIAHGTPLDDVKAELEQIKSHSARFRTSDGSVVYVDSHNILEVLDNILDNIGKAESEDT